MPDHMHLILTPCLGPRGKPWTLVRIAGSIKSYSAHQINRRAGRLGPVWQRGFYDRIVRSESDLEEKVRYLWENPVRAGIVEAPEDYPFAWNRWYHTDAES